MNRNHLITVVIGAVVVSGASFWGGMSYANSATVRPAQYAGGSFPGRQGGFRASTNGGAFGTIVSLDANSITVQLGPSTGSGKAASTSAQTNGNESGSKIVIFDSTTQIGKFVIGSASDLAVGENVIVAGTPNSDGSMTAQSIQIRPTGKTGPRSGQ